MTQEPCRRFGPDWGTTNGRNFIAMLEAYRASGGAVPGTILDQLLREYRVAKPATLAELVDSGQLFGFAWRAILWIPMFQFEAEDLALKPCAQRVRARLPQLSGWELACWFARPNDRLAGQAPVDTMDSDFEAVLRATLPHNPRVYA